MSPDAFGRRQIEFSLTHLIAISRIERLAIGIFIIGRHGISDAVIRDSLVGFFLFRPG
jgi:hypothetical protein